MKTNSQRTDSSVHRLPTRQQSLGEEIANSVTHGIGAALSLAALVLLVVFAGKTGDAWRIVSLSIYGAALFFLYLISTLYHSFTSPRTKQLFRLLDHSSIFLLIAGTYTPVTLISMRGPWGWTIFALIWALAIAGIVGKIFLLDKFRVVSVMLYIAMGWLIVIAVKPMLQMVPPGLILWLVIGGLCYSLGVVFYAFKQVPYFHFIWHLFVLSGSISHFFGMLFYLARTAAL
ncbi:MAG TPA: hemolysin III family protein [bacterium]|nr:hemolysin III family protein [bacterium]HPG46043.1 hemolysin III family protein [bacterium]HPM97865.1 hemolysin III family protein [bacterium]